MTIRRLTAADAAAFHALRLQALADCPAAFTSSVEEERSLPLSVRAQFLDGSDDRQIFGSFEQDQLTGMTGLGRETGPKLRHKGFIRSVYVVPARRRRGVGRALLQRALEQATAWSDLRQVSLVVSADNAPAMVLYRSLGFVAVWTEHQALCVDGRWHDEVHMVRRLRHETDPAGPQVRPYRDGDREAVIALWQRCGLLRPWNDPQRDIDRKQQVQPELFFVGMEAGRLVATAMAGWEGHRGWVNYLAVEAADRRRGWGRRLMERVEHELARRGCPKLNLQVRRENALALSFYRPLGYEEDAVISLGKRLIPDLPAA